MIESLDISDIPAEHDSSNLSKQSSLRQLHEQTSNANGTSNNYYPQLQQQIPVLNQSTGRRAIPNNNGSVVQGQIVSPYILNSPTAQNQSSNAPLPPTFKRENANQHSIKRSRQPIFNNPYQSNSLSRNQSPSQHIYVQHNMSSGNLSAHKITTNQTQTFNNHNTSLGQIKTDSFHTCAEQSNNYSGNQHLNSLLFRKFNQSFEKSDQKGPAPLQSPYLNLEKNDTESFMSVNSNQNISIPNTNTNTNINQITRRIFSNTSPSIPIFLQSPQQTLDSPNAQTIESKPIPLDNINQIQDLRTEMMRYADSFFQSLKRDVQDNFNKIQEMDQVIQEQQADLRNKYLDENRVKAKPTKIDNSIIEKQVEQIVDIKLRNLDKNQREIAEQIQNIKKEVKNKLDQSLSEALKGRAVNSMVENKLEILKSDLEQHQRQKLEALSTRCKLIENNYQNSQLFEDLNEFARNRANMYENKLLNLENLLNKLKKTIDEKINIGDIKGQFKEVVEQKAYQIQLEIDELKLQPQFSNNSLKLKGELEQKLKTIERNVNDQLYTLETEQKLHINNKPDMDRVNKAEEKMMRFNQDMKVLQTWYTKLSQDFQKIRVNNESNEQLLKQFEEINERINVLHDQQRRLSNTQFKYESNEVEGLYKELQNISKNLHEIDEYKKQKFELLERKLNSSKEEMDKKIQNLISQINTNKQPLSSLQSIPGIRIKMKQQVSNSAQKQKSHPSSDSNLTIYQTTNSTQKSLNTLPAQGIYDHAQFSSENYSNKNSIISSANNSYVYNQKQQPFVHPPGRSPLQITQMSTNENHSFTKNHNPSHSNQKDGVSDEQILINSNKHLKSSFTSSNKQLQAQSPTNTQNSELRPTKYKFSEQFNDDDDDDFEYGYSGKKQQKIELKANSSEDEEEIQQIQAQTLRKQMMDQQKMQQQYPQQQQFATNNRNSSQQNEKNRFQAYSITNQDIHNEQISDDVCNPLENRLKQNKSYDFDQNINNIINSSSSGFNNNVRSEIIQKGSNKQFFVNQDNQLSQKSGISRDSDPINLDFVEGLQKSSISLSSSNANTPFNRLTQQQNQQYQQQQEQTLNNYATFSNNQNTNSNYQRTRQNSLGNGQNNKVENPYMDFNQQNNQSIKSQDPFQKSLQIKDPSIPNQIGGGSLSYQSISKMNQQNSQQTPQFNNQFGFNNEFQKQNDQRNKSDSSFATPAGSLNNSQEIEQDKVFKQQQSHLPHQQHYQQSNKNQLKQSQTIEDKKGLKYSQNQKTPDQSQNLEDLLDQFEDFNENNIDAMSNSGEFYDNEEEEDIYSYQNQISNSQFSKTQGLSTLKNAQLNQINEEDEEEGSHLGFSYSNQNKFSINSNKNNLRGSEIQPVNNIKNSSHMQEYMDVINSVKMQNNVYKIVDQIQRLLELKNEKKLRCHRDEVGYLKDANGFYIFDTEGRMIKTDKESINYLQNEGYIQLL